MFWNVEKCVGQTFRKHFHTTNYSIWGKSDEELLQHVLPTHFSTFQNLHLGSIILSKFLVQVCDQCRPNRVLKPLKSGSK